MKHIALAALVTPLLLNSGIGIAQHEGHAGHAMPTAGQTSAEPSEATIKKIDKAGAKVTLAHGPLKNLGMPPMTMVFKVKDAKVLGAFKEGDKVRFVAEQSGSDYFAAKLEKAK